MSKRDELRNQLQQSLTHGQDGKHHLDVDGLIANLEQALDERIDHAIEQHLKRHHESGQA